MSFSLDEIRQLLSFRDSPEMPKPQIRQLVSEKLFIIEAHINELSILRDELKQLTSQCQKNQQASSCPILEGFEKPST